MTAALFKSFDSVNSLGDIVNHPIFDSLPLPMDALEAAAVTNAAVDSAAAANPKPAPVAQRSALESQLFVDSMRAIFNSNKKTAAAAVKPDAPISTTLESLEDLTHSQSWSNLGPHQEVNVADIFCTQQEASVEPMSEAKVEKKPAATSAATASIVRSKQATKIIPNDRDVLLGRGGRSGNHPGNKRYLALKDEMQVQYFVAEKNEKKTISQKIVDIVNKDWNGRFLKLEKGQWVEIGNAMARQKASQALRELNTPEVRAKKRARYGK